jgi:hypothetical protein
MIMNKIKNLFKNYSPWSYLISVAMLSLVLRLVFKRLPGDGFDTLASLLTLLAGAILAFFFLWVVVLGVAALLRKTIQLKEFIFSLIPVVILLVLIEVVFRILPPACEPGTIPSQEVQVLYHPETINSIPQSKTDVLQWNSHGFRSRDFNFNKDSSEFVLVLLGGSTATGAYAAQWENVPSVYIENHLQSYIKEKYNKTLKVYSLAEVAADVEDETFWFFKLGLHMKPDAVLSLTGINNLSHVVSNPDTWDFGSGSRSFRRMGLVLDPTVGPSRIVNAIVAFLDDKLNKYSAAYRYALCKMKGDEKDPFKENYRLTSYRYDSANVQTATHRFYETLSALSDFCTLRNIRFYTILQPFATCGPSVLENTKEKNLLQQLYLTMITSAEPYAEKLHLLDASASAGDQLEPYFVDTCHFYDEGFVILNEEIVRYLKEKL